MSLKTFFANTFGSKTCERLSPKKQKETAAERAAKVTAKATILAALIGFASNNLKYIIGVILFIFVSGGSIWYFKTNYKISDKTPTPLESYPNIDEIWEIPSKEKVGTPSNIKPDTIVFSYRNATGIPMRLILLDWYYHYYPVNDLMAPLKAWRFWDFPNNNKDSSFSEFKRSTGWYTFFVLRLDTGERWQLGTKNIFYSEWPYLIVEKTNDKNEPFKAIFSSSGESDVSK